MNTPASGLSMFRVARQRLLGAKKAPRRKGGPASYKARPLWAKEGLSPVVSSWCFTKNLNYYFWHTSELCRKCWARGGENPSERERSRESEREYKMFRRPKENMVLK